MGTISQTEKLQVFSILAFAVPSPGTVHNEVIDPTAHVPMLVPHAEFIDVHGILYNPLSLAPLPLPGWDLDKTFNLSALKGTFTGGDQNRLFFLGADGGNLPAFEREY